MSRCRRALLLCALLLAGVLQPSRGQIDTKALQVSAPSAASHMLYGWRVDMTGEWGVLAAPFEEINGIISAGRVYLHSAAQNWQQAQVVELPNPQAVRTFGMSVALSDDLLAVGAPGDHDGALMSGAVYVYAKKPTGWELSATVLNPEPAMGARFGGVVDLSPRTLAVSAFRSFGSAEKSGSVYVFERDTTSWSFVQELFPAALVPDEAFGLSLRVLDDSTIAVGRSMSDPFEGRNEAVTVFARRGGNWLQQDLAVPTGGTWDLFGSALASNDRYLAVGVPGAAVGGVRCGSVVIYDRTTLQPFWTVVNPLPAEIVYFGGSLSMTGDRLYVGGVRPGTRDRRPTGIIAGYDLPVTGSAPVQWYPLEDEEGLPHSCPQVSATDSVVLASSPFSDVGGIADAGMARFFPAFGPVGADNPSVPLEYSLSQNFPNPFNAMTRIQYSLKAPGRVRLDLYNILGQRVATVVHRDMKEGKYSASLNAAGLASGVYFYRLTVNDYVALKKLLVLK